MNIKHKHTIVLDYSSQCEIYKRGLLRNKRLRVLVIEPLKFKLDYLIYVIFYA